MINLKVFLYLEKYKINEENNKIYKNLFFIYKKIIIKKKLKIMIVSTINNITPLKEKNISTKESINQLKETLNLLKNKPFNVNINITIII